MSQHNVFSPLNRRRFLQYSGSMTLGGSLLAACAGTGNSGNTTANVPNLTQWYHQYGETGTQAAVLRYAKNYKQANVKVSWVAGVGNAYQDKVHAALLGSGAPDVFELPNIGVDLVKANLLEPLDDIIADAKADFLPASLKPFMVNGKVYAIKMINDPTFVYYRKSMFQAAGITEVPATVDDLIAASKKLASGSVKGIYVGPDGGADALHQIAGWASGGDFLSPDNKTVIFNTDRMAQVYGKLHDLYTSGSTLPDAPDFWWNPAPFIQGQVAMQWCGLWAMPQIKTALNDDFGIFPFPALDSQSKAATVDGGWAEMVYAKGKNVQAAKDYVKALWINSAPTEIDWNVGYGFHVPPRVSISSQAGKLKTGTAAAAVDILNKYGHSMSPYWDSAMDNILLTSVGNIIKNGNAKTELAAAADKCSTELQSLQ